MLTAKSRHTSLRSLGRYARPGLEAVGSLTAEANPTGDGADRRMTPDARVLQFPPSAGARSQHYGPCTRELSADELAGSFFAAKL